VPRESAGILLYRRGEDGGLEVLVAHPGGPLWARRDAGAWSIVKGEVEPGETPEAAARRELVEELGERAALGLAHVPLLSLGSVRQKSGKLVHAWAAGGDVDPAAVQSSTFEMTWPPRSGRQASFPEIDRVEWVPPERARELLNPAQAPLVDRLLAAIDAG
jgi:predicted NUDIX family NTP pyrophosphohydrolase